MLIPIEDLALLCGLIDETIEKLEDRSSASDNLAVLSVSWKLITEVNAWTVVPKQTRKNILRLATPLKWSFDQSIKEQYVVVLRELKELFEIKG